MNIINDEILKIKIRLDELLSSIPNRFNYDNQISNVIKQTKVNNKKLFLEVCYMKCKNGFDHKSEEIDEQINIFLDIYETIEISLEELSFNYFNSSISDSKIINDIIKDIDSFEDVFNKLQDEFIKMNDQMIGFENTFVKSNELNTMNFNNYVSKVELEQFKNDLKGYLDSINEKIKNYDIKKINFS